MKMTGAEIRLVDWEKVGPHLFIALQSVIEDEKFFSLSEKTQYEAQDAHVELLQYLKPLELVG